MSMDWSRVLCALIYGRTSCFAGALLAVIATGACAPATILVKVRPVEKIDALVERLAGTVGIYYPAEFRNYVGADKFTVNGDVMQSPLGEPSVAMFEESLASLFQNVVVLAEWPSGKPPAPAVDLVVVPRIDFFSIRFPQSGSGYRVSVGYALSILTPTGNELANWNFTGSGDVEIMVFPHDHSHFGRAIGMALQNASAQLLAGISTHPTVVSRFKPETVNLK